MSDQPGAPKPQRKQDAEVAQPGEGPSTREQALAAKKRGNTAFAAQDWKTAITEFTDAIALDPTDHVFYSNRSGCYANLKEYETALKDARKCVETKPDWPKGYSRIGYALYQMGQYDEAKAEYEKGLEIAPDNATLKEGLSQAEKALERSSNPMAKMFDDNMWGKLHQDPVTREYLKDNAFRQKLEMCQKNPQLMSSLLSSDEKMKAAFGVLLGIGSSFGSAGPGPKDDDASSKDEKPEPESAPKEEAPKKEAPKKEVPKKEASKKKGPEIVPMSDDSSDDSAEEIQVTTNEEQEENRRKEQEKKKKTPSNSRKG